MVSILIKGLDPIRKIFRELKREKMACPTEVLSECKNHRLGIKGNFHEQTSFAPDSTLTSVIV